MRIVKETPGNAGRFAFTAGLCGLHREPAQRRNAILDGGMGRKQRTNAAADAEPLHCARKFIRHNAAKLLQGGDHAVRFPEQQR